MPFLVLMNPSFRYMAGGTLRNFLAFGLWSLSDYAIILFPFIHISSAAYSGVYLILKRLDVRKSLILISSSFILSQFIPSNFFRVTRYILKPQNFLKYAWDYGHWAPYLLVSSTILVIAWIDKRKITSWMILYSLVFLYVYHTNFMMRLVYISYFPSNHLITGLEENQFNEIYLILLSLFFLTFKIP